MAETHVERKLSQLITGLEEALLGEDFHAYSKKDLGFKDRHVRRKSGEFPYIPYENGEFIRQLEIVSGLLGPRNSKGPAKFLDVGCGIGTKLLMAHDAGFDAFGVEKYPKYVRAAQRLVGKKGVVMRRDALNFNYAGYDVIYFYCPLSDRDKELALEARIITTATPGTLFMPRLCCEALWEDKTKVERIYTGHSRDVYRRI
jgi:SAM-dependent methyltransferase